MRSQRRRWSCPPSRHRASLHLVDLLVLGADVAEVLQFRWSRGGQASDWPRRAPCFALIRGKTPTSYGGRRFPGFRQTQVCYRRRKDWGPRPNSGLRQPSRVRSSVAPPRRGENLTCGEGFRNCCGRSVPSGARLAYPADLGGVLRGRGGASPRFDRLSVVRRAGEASSQARAAALERSLTPSLR